MQLRGIKFEPCWDAPGVRGFFGEGYWPHHFVLTKRWYDFEGSTRVAKTATLNRQEGNMPLDGNFQPIEMFPKAIWYQWITGETLNAINLSGPGAAALFASDLLEDIEPFMISFMAIGKTVEMRRQEFRGFAALLRNAMNKRKPASRFVEGRKTPFALHINISCPNTGHDPGDLIEDGESALEIFGELGIPLILKINILAPVPAVVNLMKHPNADALCFSNAIPFGAPLTEMDWKRRFPKGSPLKQFGGGGYSRPDMIADVCLYARMLRTAGMEKPINLGGGIRSANDVDFAVDAAELRPGIDSIFFASAAIVRPWNIRSIIDRAHERLG